MDAELERVTFNRIKLAADIAQSRTGKPIVLAHSGGKDSQLCLDLLLRSGQPFEVEHNLTTADAPETIYHVREVFAGLEREGVTCRLNYPMYKGERTTMWDLIPQKGIPPTRMQRYCCAVCKEGNGKGRMVMTGVRWDESIRRKNTRGIYENYTAHTSRDKIVLMNDNAENRDILEQCRMKAKLLVNPVVDWSTREVWQYLHEHKVPMNPLYFRGFQRVGCLGCPMAGKKRWTEFRLYPTFERAYRRAFAKMLEVRRAKRPHAPTNWKTADDVFHWWMEDRNLDGQMHMEDFLDERE